MNRGEMIKDLNDVLFEIGNENSSYARYFVGQSYLNMLSTYKLSKSFKLTGSHQSFELLSLGTSIAR